MIIRLVCICLGWNLQILIWSKDHLSMKTFSVTFWWCHPLAQRQDNSCLEAGLGVGWKQAQIDRVKSLLLPLCPACPMITKETCQWDPWVYSYSLPAPTELVGTLHSFGQSKSQSACSELKGKEDTTEKRGEERLVNVPMCWPTLTTSVFQMKY